MTRRDGPKKNLVRILALAGLYVLTGKAGLMLATVTRSISLVWPPTGLSLAALVLFGPELWPGVFLGAFLTNALTPDMSWLAASGIALGNTLEATGGVALLRRRGFLSSLERVSDVVSLVILGAASVAVSASIGTACLWLHGALTTEALPVAWREWWTGDLLSDLVLAPVLLSWGSAARLAWNQAKVLEGAVLLGSATVVTVSPLGLLSATEAIPQRYAVFPFVIWAALRFGVRGAAIANVLTSSVATLATIHGVGPFGGMTFAQSLLLQQVFMGVVALT